MQRHPLSGIHAAALTPLTTDLSPDLDALPPFLSFLYERGCHGALILGTTGEGPSFSPEERKQIMQAAARVRETHPDFVLMAGTGTPSLEETIQLTRQAFNLGYDAVVTLPPYYFRNASVEGLFTWYHQLITRALPADGFLLGYHIPAVSGVPLPHELLERLNKAFPTRFAGLKDSSGELENAVALAEKLQDQAVLVGKDTLLSASMQAGGAGAITALANLESPKLRAIYDAINKDEHAEMTQAALDASRAVLDAHPPAPATLKAMLHALHGYPLWPVKPPLLDLSPAQVDAIQAEFKALVS